MNKRIITNKRINETIEIFFTEKEKETRRQFNEANAFKAFVVELQKVDKLYTAEQTKWDEAKANTIKVIIDECTCEHCLHAADFISNLELK